MPEQPIKAGRRSRKRSTKNLGKGKSYFLGIGIDEYNFFSNLNCAVKDVKDILRLLEERYDIDKSYTLFNNKATFKEIIRIFHGLIKEVTPKDKLLIYFSGHGYKDMESDRGYWLPQDAAEEQFDTFLPNSRIRQFLEDIKAKHILLISDSCFSGTLLEWRTMKSGLTTKLEEFENINSRWVLCSGRDDEVVADGKPGGNSPFATGVISTLTKNRDYKLNVQMFGEIVFRNVNFRYNQLANCSPYNIAGHKGGQYIFILKNSIEAEWHKTLSIDSEDAYSSFVRNYPKSNYAKEAMKRISLRKAEITAWLNASETDTVEAYVAFLKENSESTYMLDALQKISELDAVNNAWIAALKENSIIGYDLFVETYPNCQFTFTASELRAKLLANASKSKIHTLHRGRIQIQGGMLELSETWSQEKPLSEPDAIFILEKLKSKLTIDEFESRKQLFENARKFINTASQNGGVLGGFAKTFRHRQREKGRLDIEVLSGLAFK